MVLLLQFLELQNVCAVAGGHGIAQRNMNLSCLCCDSIYIELQRVDWSGNDNVSRSEKVAVEYVACQDIAHTIADAQLLSLACCCT